MPNKVLQFVRRYLPPFLSHREKPVGGQNLLASVRRIRHFAVALVWERQCVFTCTYKNYEGLDGARERGGGDSFWPPLMFFADIKQTDRLIFTSFSVPDQN